MAWIQSVMSSGSRAGADSNRPREKQPKDVPAFYSRRKKRGNELCQILIRSGEADPADVRLALRLQEDRGGQVGRILVKMGACSEQAMARALAEQVALRHQAAHKPNVSELARKNPGLAGLKVECKTAWVGLALVLTDATLLFGLAGLFAALEFAWFRTYTTPILAFLLTPALVTMLVLAFAGNYSPIAPSPPDELRSLTIGISLAFLIEELIILLSPGVVPGHIQFTLVLLWAIVTVCLPIVRALVRALEQDALVGRARRRAGRR